ncbi:Uncharacterized protein SCF082_LOCUS51147 [Durusdinium trenchii]|uniref:Uncharacterized protein n=1 Tax=Durusdinium trenchii TaxID=1381693 RepID=A0ABP0SCJ9_9DINO
MAMLSEGRLSAREGSLGMQQKMLRQRELVLKRQTEAVKSFGVVAQQHAPSVDTPRQAFDWVRAPEVRREDAAGKDLEPAVGLCAPRRLIEEAEEKPEVTPESMEHSMTLDLESIEQLDAAEAEGKRNPEHVGQGWNLDVGQDCGADAGRARFWAPWRRGEAPQESSVQAVNSLELGAASPEPWEPKRGSAGGDGYGERASALNMGRVATPWISAGQNLALPGELQPEDMVEPVLEEPEM